MAKAVLISCIAVGKFLMYRLSGKVINHKLCVLDPWWDAVAQKLEGQNVVISIKRWSQTRSNQQNRYYWGVVLKTIADEIGYADPQELHEALAEKFLGWDGPGGLRMRKSTAELSVDEFSNYVDKVKMWAEAELGIVVPDSD